ncbi:insulinase family protein [Dasania sp. GY-MA-18]|uniref:Protease 3 n=1 Tax=Dasania phycosphaerae TaxID=2950436 RepID=A0A9J6RPR2_9GAMM|nr:MULTISPECIES: insulinase family protein [Dasania]MCR8923904.1 insulinase family protein [Dasania sp. GY-MA-18]MCZ0866338.1 insulinase family protein [Dasania phycosphaerae]MCZ0870062.1 insulinase family protein [Dasania phycosphaerae]
MNKVVKGPLLGLLGVFLVACSFFPYTQQPIVSDNDSRSYQALVLNNQLKVLLISDPRADKAAASLDLHIGSRQDPQQSEGLAHFLEHMLFLGTEKYPEPGEYQAFISQHGGNHNAYTAFEHTNYFFDIEPQYLEPALDRFAQFFVAPLFSQQYVEREKNAVHSEYMAKLKSDGRKSLDVFKEQINPQHPFAKFSVGNLTTLSSSTEGELRAQLIAFYQQYYSANLMSLVVIGREPLSELQTMVQSRFAAIANRKVQLAEVKQPLFTPGALPKQILIQPEREQRTLTLNFPVDDVYQHYQKKPLVYLGNIIGHEGKGSLLSFLKQQGWAEALSAGAGLSYKGGANFNITIKLTELGYQQYPQVTKAVFQLLVAMQQAGPQAWLYEEQAKIAANHFRYQESVAPIHYSRQLASYMHYYPMQDVLRGPYMMEQFDADLIRHYLAALNPHNLLLTLTAPEVAVDRHSHYYQTPYSTQPIDPSQLQAWSQAEPNPALQLPSPNHFIASDFQLLPAADPSPVPQWLVQQPHWRWWFKNDDSFNIPKGFISISLRSPMAGQSAQQAVLLKLYARMLQEQVNEYAYPAALAGLNYSLKNHMRGLSLKVSGFNEKQPLLFKTILTAVVQPEFDEQRFATIKADMQRSLENAVKQQPYNMLMNDLTQLMYRSLFTEQDKLKALTPLTLVDLQNYVAGFLQQLDVDALVYGNYSRQQAQAIAATAQQLLPAPAAADFVLPSIEIRKLAAQPSAISVANEYSDAALLYYVQASDDSPASRATLEVAAQLYQADFYTSLRTEKQLGYIVTSGSYPMHKVPGLFFVVQSPVAGVQSLQREFQQFLADKQQGLAQLSEQEFQKAKQVLVARYAQKDSNLGESQERFWQDIALGEYGFDSRQQRIAALNALSFTQWQQLIQQQLFADNSRSLWLYTAGKLEQGEGEQEAALINPPGQSLEAFSAQQGYYSFQ